MNWELLCPLYFRKKQDIDKEIRLYHLHVIQIANAIPNHKQADIQNIEQSVDILKSGKLQQDTNSAPAWVKTPYPFLPNWELSYDYKIMSLNKFSQGKTSLWQIVNSFTKSGNNPKTSKLND